MTSSGSFSRAHFVPHDGDMRDAVTRAGAAAIARAEGVDVPADPSAAPLSGGVVVISGRDERRGPDGARGGVVLPDEVVTRILRFVLEGSEGDGAHARWSVGGRFRVPAPDAARRRSHDGERLADANGASHENDAPGDSKKATPAAKRGCLRLVSKQWRRVLDQTCVEVEVRKAVVFGDEALAGLAEALRVGDDDDDDDDDDDAEDEKNNRSRGSLAPRPSRSGPAPAPAPARRLVLEGSHLCDGAFRLTTRGISLFAARLPSLASLHVERTGMDVADVLSVAARCPNLTELFLHGGADARNAPVKKNASSSSKRRENPFESALLHDMPCASPYAAMDALASLLRAGAGRLRSVSLIGAPGAFFTPAFFAVSDAENEKEGISESPSGVCAALSECSSLQSLTLEDVGVSDLVGARIARSLPNSLETFAVAGDDVGPKTGASIAAVLLADETPALTVVRVPRRAAFGAAAATKLDEALAFRAAEADICTEGKKRRNALTVRVAEDPDPRANDPDPSRFEVERFAFSMRVLRRWKVSTRTEREKLDDKSKGSWSSWCLSSDVCVSDTQISQRAFDATRAARATLRYLAAREDAEFGDTTLCASSAGVDRFLSRDHALDVWATTCVGASFDTSLTIARDWLVNRPRDDSLAAIAARVAARERFSRLAGAMEARLGRFREEAISEKGIGHRPTTCHERDAAAFDEITDAVARDARDIVDEFGVASGGVNGFREDLSDENETHFGSADPALRRALACVALPAALARAAAEDDTASGRDERGCSRIPSLPPFVVDLVHDETIALLVAEDLVFHDADRAKQRPPLVDAPLFFGGSAWCALEATSRSLAPTDLDLKFRELEANRKNGASSRRWSSASFLAPDALPLWIDAGVAGSPEDAALAADVVASALFRLAGHESVSLGARGLKELAKILGKAAALVPDDAFDARGEGVARKNKSWHRLHDAARAVFAARDFAPLLRGNVAHVESARVRPRLATEVSNGASKNSQVKNAETDASSGIDVIKSSPPPPIVSWSQWLHASGAPPPLDAATAAAAAAALRDKSAAYERMEAEAASLRARMSRLAFDLRRVARDVRTSHGFHREPAREMLLRAYGAVGFRAAPLSSSRDSENGHPQQTAAREVSCRVRQTTLVESFWRNPSRLRRSDARGGPSRTRGTIVFEPNTSRDAKAKARFAIHRVPNDGWREETLAALDALFAHARRAAPFFRLANDESNVDQHENGKENGWSLVNDADDYHGVPIFVREWERRCCAAMLAWYVDVRDDENNFSRHALDDVLRVLGAANASDEESFCAVTSSDGRERFPVDAAARLRREGSLSRREGSNGGIAGDDKAFAKTVELDARLRWNLMLEA